MIGCLRDEIKSSMSEPRFEHTLGVELTAVKIGIALGYNDINALSAASLLHDVTKEYYFEKQLKICDEFGIILRTDEIKCPQTLHAITAAAIIPAQYPHLASDVVISAVRWHTTGRKNMTLTDKIICLSDYIEPGRQHIACVSLRDSFWRDFSTSSTYEQKVQCLNSAVKTMLANTVDFLSSNNKTINLDTLEALQDMQTVQ